MGKNTARLILLGISLYIILTFLGAVMLHINNSHDAILSNISIWTDWLMAIFISLLLFMLCIACTAAVVALIFGIRGLYFLIKTAIKG